MPHLLGKRIGHYRVADLLGEGGMGKVYVGYDETLDRMVALKSMRADHRLNAETKARFLREARVLSQLAHPNICQIYDYIEGSWADFLVLELISGQRLTEAMKQGLDFRQKLRIAEEIAGVLVAAHGKGIVHRDLKPDNIMLAEGGQVKVLDFGLSRTQQDEASSDLSLQRTGKQPSAEAPDLESEGTLGYEHGHTLSSFPSAPPSESGSLTRLGTIMGTLGYMSPEQACGEPAATASDLYSFGLLLQELFTGKPPYDVALDAAARLKKAQAGETLPVVGIDADLTVLIERLKSFAPAARPSAVDTAERLAWIRNRPVRRRKKILLAAAMGLLALFGAAMTVQTLRAVRAEKSAREEAATSKQVSEFLVGLFRVSDPSETKGNTITAREILDQGARKIETELNDQPLVQARMMDTMGNVYVSLGLYKTAEPLLEKALKARESRLHPDHPDVAGALNDLGQLYYFQSRYAEAESLFVRALAIREKALGPNHLDVAESLNNLGLVFHEQGRYAKVEPLYKRTLAIMEKVLGPDHPDLATALNNLAYLYRQQGRYGEAEPVYKHALAIMEKVLGPDHPDVALLVNNLAQLYRDQGRYGEAEPLFLRALAIREKTLEPDHPDVATALNTLGELYWMQGRYAEAEPLYHRALAIREKAFGLDHADVTTSLNGLGLLYYDQGRHAKAESLHARALAIREKTMGPGHPYTAISLNNLAMVYHAQGRYAEAEPLYLRALAIREKALGQGHPDVARGLHHLGRLYREEKRFKESEDSFRRALAIYDRAATANPQRVAETLTEYAKLLRMMDRALEADSLEARAREIAEAAKAAPKNE